MWPNSRLCETLGIDLPIIQAPVASAGGSALAAAATAAGGHGSLPCAILDVDKIRTEIRVIRQQTYGPINVNFVTHRPPGPDPACENAWRERLRDYYDEFGLDPDAKASAVNRAPFDEATCEIVEVTKPEVVSFHFGLPAESLLDRAKAAGCRVISFATTVAQAEWLVARGCDAIIAQCYEAGGHRGIFLNDDVFAQAGTMALVPQVIDAVDVPVVATGGITDGRGIAAAFALGAAGVQIGTAYLFTLESPISDLYREALRNVRDDQTALTNVFTGRPARGVLYRLMRDALPISDAAPAFPAAGGALTPLKAAAEAQGSVDFTSLGSDQTAALGREIGAADLTWTLAAEALDHLSNLSGRS